MNFNRYLKNSTKLRFRRLLVGFLVSVMTTYTLSSIVQSVFVIASLEKAGADVPLDMWPSIFVHDWLAMTLSSSVRDVDIYYALIIIVGLLIAFPSAALVCKLSARSKWLLYPLAGAVAMGTILYFANKAFYNLPFYAGTRSVAGYCAQLLVGALGGGVFASFLSTTCDTSSCEKSGSGRSL